MSKKPYPKIKDTVAMLERVFGEDVQRISAPGGKGRASYRVFFDSRTIIVTFRDRDIRAQIETDTLRVLSPHCADMPRFLGVEGDYIFQSDAGTTRLSQAAYDAKPAKRLDLAADAVAAIFRIQSAARRIGYGTDLPMIAAQPRWIAKIVDAVDKVAAILDQAAPHIDRAAICEAITHPPAQFIRWDCRSGNAAIDELGKLRWFDFEYSSMRHGAEDIAWLIADEVWSVSAPDMFDIVADGFDPQCGHARDDYMDFLSLFATFQAIQRVRLVMSEVDRRGWSSQARALHYDKVGTHPELGHGIAMTAAYCADRHVLTRPLRPMLESMGQMFLDALPEEGRKLAS